MPLIHLGMRALLTMDRRTTETWLQSVNGWGGSPKINMGGIERGKDIEFVCMCMCMYIYMCVCVSVCVSTYGTAPNTHKIHTKIARLHLSIFISSNSLTRFSRFHSRTLASRPAENRRVWDVFVAKEFTPKRCWKSVVLSLQQIDIFIRH